MKNFKDILKTEKEKYNKDVKDNKPNDYKLVYPLQNFKNYTGKGYEKL